MVEWRCESESNRWVSLLVAHTDHIPSSHAHPTHTARVNMGQALGKCCYICCRAGGDSHAPAASGYSAVSSEAEAPHEEIALITIQPNHAHTGHNDTASVIAPTDDTDLSDGGWEEDWDRAEESLAAADRIDHQPIEIQIDTTQHQSEEEEEEEQRTHRSQSPPAPAVVPMLKPPPAAASSSSYAAAASHEDLFSGLGMTTAYVDAPRAVAKAQTHAHVVSTSVAPVAARSTKFDLDHLLSGDSMPVTGAISSGGTHTDDPVGGWGDELEVDSIDPYAEHAPIEADIDLDIDLKELGIDIDQQEEATTTHSAAHTNESTDTPKPNAKKANANPSGGKKSDKKKKKLTLGAVAVSDDADIDIDLDDL